MANFFYGEAYEEHYEKEIKDFTPADWAVSIVYLAVIIAAVIFGFMQNWGLMVIMAGVAVCMLYIFMMVVFGVKNKIVQLFFLIGIFVIIGGLITLSGYYEYLILYAVFIYLTVAFGVGFFCLYLAKKKNDKIREYSLSVEADCEYADVKKINLFRFDDIISNPYNPMNDNELTKPAFHYYAHGKEYYTESEVYYGNANRGYEEGSKVVLRVNPDNPTEILPQNENASMEIILGVSWIVIGIVTITILAVSYILGVFDGIITF